MKKIFGGAKKTLLLWFRSAKWLWQHRDESNCNAKYKRMAKALYGTPQRNINKWPEAGREKPI